MLDNGIVEGKGRESFNKEFNFSGGTSEKAVEAQVSRSGGASE